MTDTANSSTGPVTVQVEVDTWGSPSLDLIRGIELLGQRLTESIYPQPASFQFDADEEARVGQLLKHP